MADLTKDDVSEIVNVAVDKLALAVQTGFGGVDKDLNEVKSKIEGLKTNFNALQTSVDSFVSESRKISDEQISIGAQLDRHEGWIQRLASKIGLKLGS